MDVTRMDPDATPPAREAFCARPSIGHILVESGRLDAGAAARIAESQVRERMRFGEAGVRLKLLVPEDVRFALSVQFSFPFVEPGGASFSPVLAAALSPLSPVAEQMRSLRTRLILSSRQAGLNSQSVAILSAGRQEGRSLIAANLAISMAQAGERVLLIDADLRHPRQHSFFGLGRRPGLSEILCAGAGLEAAVPIAGFQRFAVLGAGAEPPNPQELLSRINLADLLLAASLQYDRLVIDTPSAEHCSDAYLVAAQTTCAVLVARLGVTEAHPLGRLRAALAQTPARLVGAVMNEF